MEIPFKAKDNVGAVRLCQVLYTCMGCTQGAYGPQSNMKDVETRLSRHNSWRLSAVIVSLCTWALRIRCRLRNSDFSSFHLQGTDRILIMPHDFSSLHAPESLLNRLRLDHVSAIDQSLFAQVVPADRVQIERFPLPAHVLYPKRARKE